MATSNHSTFTRPATPDPAHRAVTAVYAAHAKLCAIDDFGPYLEEVGSLHNAALKEAIRTPPASLTGLLALLELIQHDAGFAGFVIDDEDVDALLDTITKSVSRLTAFRA
jgi:hypothetical protein